MSTGLTASGAELRGGLLFDVGVPRRDGQPQHVGAGARVARGDGVDEPAHVGRQHPLGRHHPVQPAQLADMVCVRTPFEDERVDQPAVEAHPHAHTGLRVVGLFGGHQIVELAVQVRHRQHRQHPGDRLVLGLLVGCVDTYEGVADGQTPGRRRSPR